MGDSHVGLQARLMSQALRKITGALSNSGTTAIFINQLREKIGVMFGSPETTTGGEALKFYASVRLDVRRIETLKDGTGAGRQPHPGQGREEQGEPAVQAGRVRHPLRHRHLPRGRPDRHGRRAGHRPQVRRLVHLRGRPARPGQGERALVPARQPRPRRTRSRSASRRSSASGRVSTPRRPTPASTSDAGMPSIDPAGGGPARRGRRRPARSPRGFDDPDPGHARRPHARRRARGRRPHDRAAQADRGARAPEPSSPTPSPAGESPTTSPTRPSTGSRISGSSTTPSSRGSGRARGRRAAVWLGVPWRTSCASAGSTATSSRRRSTTPNSATSSRPHARWPAAGWLPVRDRLGDPLERERQLRRVLGMLARKGYGSRCRRASRPRGAGRGGP